jgi:hypothetical protein
MMVRGTPDAGLRGRLYFELSGSAYRSSSSSASCKPTQTLRISCGIAVCWTVLLNSAAAISSGLWCDARVQDGQLAAPPSSRCIRGPHRMRRLNRSLGYLIGAEKKTKYVYLPLTSILHLLTHQTQIILYAHIDSVVLLATPVKSTTSQPFAFRLGTPWAEITAHIWANIPAILQHRSTPTPRETCSLNQ